MPRVAIIGDSHFDQHNRFGECIRIHDWIADACAERRVDLVLHSGDIYERRSTPDERLAVASWLSRLAAFATVVLVRGNHDAPLDPALMASLETRFPVHVVESAEVFDVCGVAVAAVAWPRKAHTEVAGVSAQDALRDLLRGLGAELDQYPDRPRVLLAHAMVRGSRTSTGQELLGCDMELGLEDLALARADLYALGHIHAHQHWMIDGAPAIYPGSPRRANFGEMEDKGFVVADFEGAKLKSWGFVRTPATPMIHLDAEWLAEGLTITNGGTILPGAEVRLRYRVEAHNRDAAKREAATAAEVFRSAGAVNVKVEEIVIPTTRARVPEITRSASIAEKLAAVWDSKGERPGRADELLRKLGELQNAS